MFPRSRSITGIFTAIMAAVMGLHSGVWATYQVLDSFQSPGTQPLGRLLKLASGEAYGTASTGGAFGYGSVFRVTTGGEVQTIVSFTGNSGEAPGNGPTGGLVLGSDGGLYGTTAAGGASGFGVVFRVTGTGVYTTMVNFTGTAGAAIGSVPGPLLANTDGLLYGTTEAGGASGAGTVFKLGIGGTFTNLAQFNGTTTGTRRGAEPIGALAASGSNLFGVTRRGGASNFGTIFRITTSGGFTDLFDFTGNAGTRPGANPAGGLTLQADGKFYGTTEFGGTNGFGTLFSLTNVTTPVFASLRSFSDLTGSQPAGELVASSGTTLLGCCAAGGINGLGGIYQITTANIYSLLLSFEGETGAIPGSVPRAGLTLGSDGLFHGVTSSGGPANLGTVFKITAAGTLTLIANLSPATGWLPSGAPVENGTGGWIFPMAKGGNGGGGTVLSWASGGGTSVGSSLGGVLGDSTDGSLIEKSGSFYGVTSSGAASGRGALFRYTPGTGTSLVNSHTTTTGSLAEGPLVIGADGALYGVGREGGTNAKGTFFKTTTAGVRSRIVSFTGTAGAAPGTTPRGPVAFAPNQSFYGVTEAGGASNTGVIFQVSAAAVYSVVAEFSTTGPRSPQGGLVLANDGYIYGTTSRGGISDSGTIIRLNPLLGSWSVVAEFDGSTAGNPAGELHAVADGSILGIATSGGIGNGGGVFRFSPMGGLQILATFTGKSGVAPGIASAGNGAGLTFTGGLSTAADGTIYGTAAGGGPFGGGVFFRIIDDSPMALWKTTMLGAPNASDLGDPDFDGLTNLVEYAIGTDPMAANPSPSPTLTLFGDGTSLAIQISRDPTRSDVTYLVEASSTLSPPWTVLATSVAGAPFSGPGYLSGETPGNGIKSVLIRDTATTNSAPKRFFRIRVTH